MVPDWEKASWEVRFGDDRHRYPSFSSFPSEGDENGVKGRIAGGGGNEASGGWTRPQNHQPSPLGAQRSEVKDVSSDQTQEADISTMSPYHGNAPPIPSSPTPSRQSYGHRLPQLPQTSVTRSKSQNLNHICNSTD